MMKRITCVVENTVQRGSPFWGEHGLSYRIETDAGCVLFDTVRETLHLSSSDAYDT